MAKEYTVQDSAEVKVLADDNDSIEVKVLADDNDSILSEISKHHEAIKALKLRLKPTKPRVEISLLECNKAAKAQRAEKFKQEDRISKAVTAALSRVSEKKEKSST